MSDKQKARLCFVIDSLNGGGAEMVVLRLVETINRELDNASAHLIVLSQRGDYQVSDESVVHRLEFSSNKNLDSYFKAPRVARALGDKVLALESQYGEFTAIFSNLDVCHSIIAKSQLNRPVFYIVHSSPVLELEIERQRSLFKYWRLKRRKLHLKHKHLVAVSNGVASDFNLPWLPIESVTTIYNPFDIQGISKLSQQVVDDIPNEPYVLHVGRVCAAKRHDRLLEAFSLTNTPYKLVLLTKPNKKLDRLIARYNLADRVIVKGFQANPYPWMKQAQLTVLSSDYEGLPNVLIESLICQTPIVSTDCKHGPKEILADFNPQWLVDGFTPQALAEKIDQVLSSNNAVDLEKWPLLEKINAYYSANQYVELALHAKNHH